MWVCWKVAVGLILMIFRLSSVPGEGTRGWLDPFAMLAGFLMYCGHFDIILSRNKIFDLPI